MWNVFSCHDVIMGLGTYIKSLKPNLFSDTHPFNWVTGHQIDLKINYFDGCLKTNAKYVPIEHVWCQGHSIPGNLVKAMVIEALLHNCLFML